MKKHLFLLINLLGLWFNLFAQSTNDYRSIASGNWNDPTKWERYNGSSWVSAVSYPGEQIGTGLVTISTPTEIKITETVPFPVSAIYNTTTITEEWPYPSSGVLIFSSETTVSLKVSGDMNIYGKVTVENRSGAKLHTLFIGGSVDVGFYWDYYQTETVGWFESANGDDKLHVIFNSDDPVTVDGVSGVILYDATFNCAGITGSMNINGTATFINGVVTGWMRFNDGSSVSGASPVSFVDGLVAKAGNDPFTFPIGSNNIYAPFTISAPAVESQVYYLQYRRENAEALGRIQDPGLYSVSNCEYWILQTAILGVPINVTVGWNGSSGCGTSPYIANVSEVTLASHSNSWYNHGGSGTGTTTNGSVTWNGWNGLSQVEKFTLANLKPGCPAPSEYNLIGLTPSSATLQWSIMAGSLNFDVDYKVSGSANWINAITATTSNTLTISNLATATYDWRVRSNCSSLSSTYVSGNFTIAPTNPPPPSCQDGYEINNTSRQARLINGGNAIIYSGITTPTDIDWFKLTTPNNSYTNLVITLSNLYADFDLYVYNQSNKLIGSSTKSGMLTEVVVYNSTARKATYYIKVIGKNGAFNASYCYNLLAQISNLPSSQNGKAAPQIEIPQIELLENPDRQTLYPNPASGFVNFGFTSTLEGLANVQIVNSDGKLMKQSTVRITKGYNLVKIPVNDMRPGMYLLRMNKGEMIITKRFMKAE